VAYDQCNSLEGVGAGFAPFSRFIKEERLNFGVVEMCDPLILVLDVP
jgi:hypothetical protein